METHTPPENLILYVRTGCRHCAKVLAAAEELGIQFILKNIADWDTQEELQAVGGKVQVPYLIDGDHSIEMYEADDIVRYLHETYGKGVIKNKDADTSSNNTCTL